MDEGAEEEAPASALLPAQARQLAEAACFSTLGAAEVVNSFANLATDVLPPLVAALPGAGAPWTTSRSPLFFLCGRPDGSLEFALPTGLPAGALLLLFFLVLYFPVNVLPWLVHGAAAGPSARACYTLAVVSACFGPLLVLLARLINRPVCLPIVDAVFVIRWPTWGDCIEVIAFLGDVFGPWQPIADSTLALVFRLARKHGADVSIESKVVWARAAALGLLAGAVAFTFPALFTAAGGSALGLGALTGEMWSVAAGAGASGGLPFLLMLGYHPCFGHSNTDRAHHQQEVFRAVARRAPAALKGSFAALLDISAVVAATSAVEQLALLATASFAALLQLRRLYPERALALLDARLGAARAARVGLALAAAGSAAYAAFLFLSAKLPDAALALATSRDAAALATWLWLPGFEALTRRQVSWLFDRLMKTKTWDGGAIAAGAVAQLSKLRRLLARRLSCVLGGAIGGAIGGAASAARLQLVKDAAGADEWRLILQGSDESREAVAGALAGQLEETTEFEWDPRIVMGFIDGARGLDRGQAAAQLWHATLPDRALRRIRRAPRRGASGARAARRRR